MKYQIQARKDTFSSPFFFFPLMRFSFSLFELLRLTTVSLHHRFLTSSIISINHFHLLHLTDSLVSLNLFFSKIKEKIIFFFCKEKIKTNMQPKIDHFFLSQIKHEIKAAKIPFHFSLVLIVFYNNIFIFPLQQNQLVFLSHSIFPL